MKKVDKQTVIATAQRLLAQKEIIDKFGEKAIKEAKKRLCTKCRRVTCYLLPLCSDGSDCPYFMEAEQLSF